MEAPPPAPSEGRPAAADLSPLQARVDAAPAGATIEVGAGEYVGDLHLDRPLRLVGRGRPRLVGSGHGSVVRIRAPGVTLEGFDIDGRCGGDLARDSAGVHVAAPRATIRDCRIESTLFGVYLLDADEVTVEGCRIRGIPGRDPGEKGSGIHAWSSDRFRFLDNEIADVRDGFYIQSSSHGLIRGNVARDLRYGLHYMFSDDNTFEGNTFANGAAGTALMYSRRIVFRGNRFVHNRGFASVGLLFKTCEDVLAEDNLIADNARGVFLEGSSRTLLRRNVIARSDAAIVLYDSCDNVVVEGNSFLDNLSPLTLVGRRTDTRFEGNWWSGNEEPDLDGDGFSDRPYRLENAFDHVRGNVLAADLLLHSPAASALAAAERVFPVLEPASVADPRPLARPPRLGQVPGPWRAGDGWNAGGLALALALGALGAAILARGRR
ncbi:MAG: nitrous oxide reductase family maturation protein NosD [Acidobacteria bacterium]|nr:nitrous oxide reductase family maturation protein NosD [Acidobacteriota bacterium]